MRKFHILKPGTSGLLVFALFFIATVCNAQGPGYPPISAGVWSAQKANQWYAGKGWLRGCDFIPQYRGQPTGNVAGGQLGSRHDRPRAGLAESIGLNCMRVFLHHLAWEEDPAGFRQRMDQLSYHRRPPPYCHHLCLLRRLLERKLPCRSAAGTPNGDPQFRLDPRSR